MASEVSWTRVRKYASLSRRITSWLSMTRSTARAAWRARISRVAGQVGQDRGSGRTRPAPRSAGRRRAGPAAPAGTAALLTRRRRPPWAHGCGQAGPASRRPASCRSRAAARSGQLTEPHGSRRRAAPTARKRPSSRTASSASPRGWRAEQGADRGPDRAGRPAPRSPPRPATAPACRRTRSRPAPGASDAATSAQARQHQQVQQRGEHRDHAGVDRRCRGRTRRTAPPARSARRA